MVFKDARDYQILFLSCFLFIGVIARDWTLRLDLVAVVFSVCWLTQVIASFAFKYPLSFRSATITALGLCLLLRANDYATVGIAASLAIASKFLFRVGNKHFFNPANFGIICAMIITQDAWVSPGQWGADWWLFALFLCMGGLIVNRVGRWDTSVAFLSTYVLLEALRNWWLGWTLDVLQHQLMSGSLLLFAFFMITDPRSIPNATASRLIWAGSIAVLTFILQHWFFINTAFLLALFILSPVTIWLDYIHKAPRFSWSNLDGDSPLPPEIRGA